MFFVTCGTQLAKHFQKKNNKSPASEAMLAVHLLQFPVGEIIQTANY